MRPRFVVRITPQDVGKRVTVRSRLHDEQHGATDTVGWLRGWAEGVLSIERRDGTLVRLQEGDLLAARVIPDPPPRRRAPDGPSA